MTLPTQLTDHSLILADHFREAEAGFLMHSPALLNKPRKKAFSDFVRQGIPTRKNEDYKYTNLQPSFDHDFAWMHQLEKVDFQLKDIFKCDVPQLDTHLVLLLNGWFHSYNKHSEKLPEGVILDSLEKISVESPEIILDYYTKLSDTATDPMVALNTAFAADGYVLYIPAQSVVEKPIQIINILKAQTDTFITQRNLVIVEPGAEVKLIVCDHTLNLNSYMSNSVTEVFIGEGASVDFYSVHNQHNKAHSVQSAFFSLERNANLTTQNITLHGGLVRNNLKVILNGENCEANMYGMSFMDRKQHVDNFLQVNHEKPNCRSNQYFKNVLDDESTGAFSGRIHVKRDAQKTNAYQRNNNLLLTDKALMQTKPQLIIEADDVKCSHGATVGQIDEEALFYLRARGIGESQARLMLMNAFSYEVVRQIRVEALRDRISELVDKRLRGDMARCHECAYHCDC
jgi:Fe-S cluster assembly protein SufD